MTDATAWPAISVIIPAFNEERFLGPTLEALRTAAAYLESMTDAVVEILVVDNGSTDRTAALAGELGATVVRESEHNIGKVRNAGARAARHTLLIFVDADTFVPYEGLYRIAHAMRDANCAGGAVDFVFRPKRRVVRADLDLVHFVAGLANMHMGACQFCRRDVFASLGGYDETLYMGEDVDFIWRLRAAARRRGLTTCLVRDLNVISSSRRFDGWPLWRILLMTHPLIVFGLRRRRAMWRDWYDHRSMPR